ncbi:hypothetical protein D3C81_1964860 [compost metagenome]
MDKVDALDLYRFEKWVDLKPPPLNLLTKIYKAFKLIKAINPLLMVSHRKVEFGVIHLFLI